MEQNKNARLGAGTPRQAAGKTTDRAPIPIANSTPSAAARQSIFDLLPQGEGQAISTTELVKLAGAASARELQSMIATERENGALILSRASGGYFRPSDGGEGRREIERFSATLRARALNTLRALRSARAALGEDPAQITFGDMGV